MRWSLLIVVLLASVSCAAEQENLKPGDIFKDCDTCPEMVVLPTGKGWVGLHPKAHRKKGLPWRQIEFVEPLAVGKFEVLLEEYYACVADGACMKPTMGFARGLRKNPAHNLSWFDAKSYVAWLAEKTGKPYRLLSRNEWEYAARGGTDTLYWWGDKFLSGYDICQGCMKAQEAKIGEAISGGKRFTFVAGAGIFLSPMAHSPDGPPANPFGLLYMLGNVGEWVEDCLDHVTKENYSNTAAPEVAIGDCKYRYYKGGHYRTLPKNLIPSGGRGTSGTFKGAPQEAVGTRVAINY